MSRQLDGEKLFELIRQNECFNESAAMLSSVVLPSIRLVASPAGTDGEMGQSRMGGLPDLPMDAQWPSFEEKAPMIFLAQINMSDISVFPCASALPSDGILSFFSVNPYGEVETSVWVKPDVFEHKNSGTVIYSKSTHLERRAAPDGITVLKHCDLSFSLQDTFPPTESETYETLGIKEGDTDTLHGLMEQVYGEDQPIHKMFGHPNQEQGDLRALAQRSLEKAWENPNWDELAMRGKDLVLLFQMDSDDNLDIMWGDGGRIYFFIKPDDLARGDFSRAWCETECG